MTTHAESINSDLQRGLDIRLRHTHNIAQKKGFAVRDEEKEGEVYDTHTTLLKRKDLQ